MFFLINVDIVISINIFSLVLFQKLDPFNVCTDDAYSTAAKFSTIYSNRQQ